MSNIHIFHFTPPDPVMGPKIPAIPSVNLSEQDRQQLLWHLGHCGDRQQSFLAHMLRHKIAASRTNDLPVPEDVVTGRSRVIYSVDHGPAHLAILSHRARVSVGSGVIPVNSLLGATLIGMRVGQRGPLLREDGTIGSVSVQGVGRPG